MSCSLKNSGHFINKFRLANRPKNVPCKDNCIRERGSQNLCPLLTGTRAQCQHTLSAFSACLLGGFVAPQLCELHPCAPGGRETHSRCYCVSHQFHTKKKKKSRGESEITVSFVLCGVIINSLIHFRSAL